MRTIPARCPWASAPPRAAPSARRSAPPTARPHARSQRAVQRAQLPQDLAEPLLNHRAARRKKAAQRDGKRIGGRGARPQLGQVKARLGPQRRSQQGAAIGMLRKAEQRARLGLLDLLAQMHHGNAVGQMLDHGEVVTDENHGQAQLGFQLQQQVDDLRLHRHIQRRCRLVADQNAGFQDQRTRWRRAGAGRPTARRDRRRQRARADPRGPAHTILRT